MKADIQITDYSLSSAKRHKMFFQCDYLKYSKDAVLVI